MWSIKKGQIKIEQPEFKRICSLYYCLKECDSIEKFSYDTMSTKLIQRVIPDEYQHVLQYQQKYRKELAVAIDEQRRAFLESHKDRHLVYEKIIEIVGQRVDYITYFMEVQLREPAELAARRQIGPMCLLGVNYREIVITKNENSRVPQRTLPFPKINVKLSVFSIFITTLSQDQQEVCYRFDGKMLNQIANLIQKYLAIYNKY